MGLWDLLRGKSGGGVEPSGEIFGMKIEDVFSISGVGVVVTGKIAVGAVRVGARLRVTRAGSDVERPVRVEKIERFRKVLDSAAAGEDVGLILSGVEKGDVAAGDMLQNI
jgi:elongation factor Tu